MLFLGCSNNNNSLICKARTQSYSVGCFASVMRFAGKILSEMTYNCVGWDIRSYSTHLKPIGSKLTWKCHADKKIVTDGWTDRDLVITLSLCCRRGLTGHPNAVCTVVVQMSAVREC